jgi:hypothetical protein
MAARRAWQNIFWKMENYMSRCHNLDAQRAYSGKPFLCRNCGLTVPMESAGTDHRNHCPGCLWSLHVDIQTGDRLSGCQSLMDPIAVWVRSNGEWAIVHRCRKCGTLRTNRIAGDDNEVLLISLALRPLAMPPFPLHLLSQFRNAKPSESERS